MLTDRSDPIVLVLAGDDNYACPMAVTVYSALSNLTSEWAVDLYLIDGGIRWENKSRIEQICSNTRPSVDLYWKSVDEALLASLPDVTGQVVNANTYLRLFIPNLLPQQCERAIYLDCDLIIQSSLGDLWPVPLEGKAVLAVQDFWIPYVSCDLGIEKYRELDLPADAPYFNTGVLVINPPLWREQSIRDRVAEYLIKHEAHRNFNDQEGLNAVLGNNWNPLPLSWNVPHIVGSRKWHAKLAQMEDTPFKRSVQALMPKLREGADIIHFASAAKPWKSSSHYPLQHLWYTYLWNSGWLSPREEMLSKLKFYSRYYPRSIVKRLLDSTRPQRHRLADSLPVPVARLMKR